MTYARDEAIIATPIGSIRIVGDDATLHAIRIESANRPVSRGTVVPVRRAVDQLEQWFAGERMHFDLPLEPASSPRGGALRQGMIDISYGNTESYGELAARIGSSPRAVGQSCARNPFPLIVPCHRVIGANGTLGHYSAGDGAATKRWLLDFERKYRKEDRSSPDRLF